MRCVGRLAVASITVLATATVLATGAATASCDAGAALATLRTPWQSDCKARTWSVREPQGSFAALWPKSDAPWSDCDGPGAVARKGRCQLFADLSLLRS